MEKFSLINYSQHGFTKGRSCITNLLSFYRKVYETVDNDENHDIVYLYRLSGAGVSTPDYESAGPSSIPDEGSRRTVHPAVHPSKRIGR